jgi:non-specific serine/threonine protein kinase
VAWQAGRQLTLAEASGEAMRLSEATARPEPLSAREREVAELIARGMTNRQIAERLVISERTVDRHVSNMFAKLGVGTRAQLAAWVVEQQRE